ncbi:hypothetical protein BO94DRAFT_535769 [Aspergillus sclerotioniger CBS 115572]|uniref:Uncharacterized protein n=1 Tax=Aspergillus sclerotioniger CBS 115572 TaxID=1450535 RepID=A0A317WNJ5_9EURO|nr:hypothetical protein BO94DRAFT_535769 [Aspergillus sclerotioniger CBS 115572]PWY86627.1 hypothetical protein BO94DRAFT_535769 [Aspergillus sclerotioniger CBS 115572]
MARESGQTPAPASNRRLSAMVPGEPDWKDRFNQPEFDSRYKRDPKQTFDILLQIFNNLETERGNLLDVQDRQSQEIAIFTDPNKARNARRQYSGLRMRVGEKFYAFISNFRYLAVEAGISEDIWKEDLYNKIPPKRRRQLCTVSTTRSIPLTAM